MNKFKFKRIWSSDLKTINLDDILNNVVKMEV